MHIEESTVRHIRIVGFERLDPISVTLQDFGEGQGKIAIDVWGEAWACYWGAMGKQNTISSFFQKASVDYLADKLSVGLDRSRFSNEKLQASAKKEILSLRRQGCIDEDEARGLYDDVDFELGDVESWEGCSHHDRFLSQVFGNEWRESIVNGNHQEPNPPYTYLCRVIEGVKAGLALCEKVNATQT